ncbi:nickel pincer cofactor biosynthesis protein LarC [Kyrpidia spormannii]|uniref:Pyridinium-3,5-bisthiocarboxylic acid mononucleotide nickel insertion protein n=1 Tax=Kyrpidia spormannii TaxID=2055160 RepID=A0A6F9E7A7_9BACL|nr:nickel pincer cofactor biosynthesis protein LarC [Kyrpidia spormannii]CAB3392333.1 Pyridinium-3,5-bisthiocarboxylic acid mononucleotide nickel insertion protein [Kyrpidia spormannii]
MKVAYIEGFAGASGDMFLGAWLDAGAPEHRWREILGGLQLGGYVLSIRRVTKRGITALKVDVESGGEQPHRRLADILQILDRSTLPQAVRERAIQAFRLLAEAEGKVHGTSPEDVHFHEVGAVDAIVDIVGAMAGWYLLGMPECFVSPLEVGGGWTVSAHGPIPVPAPATVELLKGFPVYSSGLWGETVTPTGAAILRTLSRPAGGLRYVADAVGYGAGSRELPVPNVLRIQVGERVSESGKAVQPGGSGIEAGLEMEGSGAAAVEAGGGDRYFVVETNVDDMSPEWAGYLVPRLLEVGALDAWIVPIIMKKGRPGMEIRALCTADRLEAVKEEIFAQSSSIGVREYEVRREALDRRTEIVETPYGPVRVKIAYRHERVVNVAPEYEDCRVRAEEHGVPLKWVYQEVVRQVGSKGL